VTALRRVFCRLANVFRPGHAEEDLEREVASHLSLLEDDYRRRGLSSEAARRASRLALGGVDQTKERHRDARSFVWLDDLRRDLTYAVRMLRRSPVAAGAATLSLALGIGLNAAMFSIVDCVLVRPLPYPLPHELVRVHTAGTNPVTGPSPLTYSDFLRFRESGSLRQSVAFTTATRILAGSGIEPVHTVVARVAGDLFDTLQVHPGIGRGFSRQEISAASPVVILAGEFWQKKFSADRAVVGRSVTIDGVSHVVVGIMPAGRGYPRDADAWRPLTVEEREDDDRELGMVARLREGRTVALVAAEIDTLARAGSSGTRTAWADDLKRTDVGDVRPALRALLAATLLVLVIACANVAALMGARGADRAGEIALRGALGATRRRLVAQLTTESVVLAAAGGAVGLLLGHWTLSFLLSIAPVSIPRLAEVALDSRIVAAALLATLLTGLGVGIMPAFRVSRLAGADSQRISWSRMTQRSNFRRGLVLAQIALAVVLTTGAGLFARSLQHLVTIDHGFAADRLVAVDLYFRGRYSGDSRQLFRELIDEARMVPGVRAVAVTARLPTQVAGLRAPVQIVGESPSATPAILRPVSPDYFHAVGIPVVEGRAFSDSDGRKAPPVAIVNRTFVRDVLGSRATIGARLTTPLMQAPVSLVGIVADVRPAGEPDRPALYVPVEQVPIGGGYLVAAAHGDPLTVMPALRDRLRSVAPGLALDRVARVAEALEDGRAVTRFSTQLAAAFAALALLLSIIGVYGMTAGEVSARWREIAVRIALGASQRVALWTVIRPSAAILAVGTTLGLVGALAAGPALASLLHGVNPDDPPTLMMAPALLGIVGILAALVAGARVLRSDPATTLRTTS
jgi:predicted permease